ncbi:MAG: M23 family metallopeptidase, partial [Angelakisella sp.]
KRKKQSTWQTVLSFLLPIIILFVLIAAVVDFVTTPSLWLEGTDYTNIAKQLNCDYMGNDEVTDNSDIVFSGSLKMPCELCPINSDYGMRVHPIDKRRKLHTGIDFGTAWHGNIYSVADGTVYAVKTDGAFGRSITIAHELNGETLYSFYAHLSECSASVGNPVYAGEIIGIEGGAPGIDPDVGKSTGHHLHFELRSTPEPGSSLDPKLYLGGFTQ